VLETVKTNIDEGTHHYKTTVLAVRNQTEKAVLAYVVNKKGLSTSLLIAFSAGNDLLSTALSPAASPRWRVSSIDREQVSQIAPPAVLPRRVGPRSQRQPCLPLATTIKVKSASRPLVRPARAQAVDVEFGRRCDIDLAVRHHWNLKLNRRPRGIATGWRLRRVV